MIIALTGLTLTGLVWVAYHHPQGYHRIYLATLALFIALSFGAMGWDAAVSVAAQSAPRVADLNIPEWVNALQFAGLGLLALLRNLHTILGPKRDD